MGSTATPEGADPNARVDGAPRESRRESILDTAATVFARLGVRTSVTDLADACGILPGSLYHHFESKGAIVVELVERFQGEIDAIATAAEASMRAPGGRDVDDVILEVAGQLADSSRRHRGALLLTLYEVPLATGSRFRRPVTHHAEPVERLVVELIRRGQASGRYRPEVDAHRLASRLCQSMVSAGIRRHVRDGPVPVSALAWGFLRDGVATRPPSNAALDRSPALRAACETIATWNRGRAEEDARMSLIRSVAGAEFGRRGYRGTTIRDIAAAAELSTATVHRLIGSKDELLQSMMRTFAANAATGWRAVLDADASPVEKIDALMWVHINLYAGFGDEFKLTLAWTLESPRDDADLGWTFGPRLEELADLVERGVASGELHPSSGPVDLQAHSLLELTWLPEELVRIGTREAHFFGRDALLRGAAAAPTA
jgi:AcrR family transcriptional regulator